MCPHPVREHDVVLVIAVNANVPGLYLPNKCGVLLRVSSVSSWCSWSFLRHCRAMHGVRLCCCSLQNLGRAMLSPSVGAAFCKLLKDTFFNWLLGWVFLEKADLYRALRGCGFWWE